MPVLKEPAGGPTHVEMRRPAGGTAAPPDPGGWIARLGAMTGLALDERFVRQVAATFATRVVLLGLGFLTTIVVARLLGPSGRGLYATAVTLTGIGVQLGTFGLHTTNTYTAARSPDRLAALLGNTLVLSLGVASMGCLLAWAAFGFFVPQLRPVDGSLFAVALLGVPLGLAYLLSQALLVGVGDVRGYNVIDLVVKSIGITLIAAVFLTSAPSVELVYLLSVLGVGLGAVFAVLRLVRRGGARPRPDLALFRDTARYGLKSYLAALFAFVALRCQLLIVEGLLGREQAGYFSVAMSIGDLVYMLPTVVGTILFPRLLGIEAPAERLRAARSAAWQLAALMLAGVLLTALVARPLVHLLFGAAYAPAVPPLLWLLPGLWFLSVTTVFFNYMASIGMPRFAVVLPGLGAASCLALSAVAVPALGIRGAALASTIAYGGMLLGCLVYTRRLR